MAPASSERALVLGYGSIGERHSRVLSALGLDVAVVSRRDLGDVTCYPTVAAALTAAPAGYAVVATETAAHRDGLAALAAAGFDGRVLVEKPLFDDAYALDDFGFAGLSVGYNLRFHPLLQRLKQELAGRRAISAQVYVGQHLSQWRPGRDWKAGYSGKKQGGGVLRDLSHELDYIAWLFGPWQRLTAVGGTYGALGIESDEVFALLGQLRDLPVLSVEMNYLDPTPTRRLVINTTDGSFHADLVAGRLDHPGGSETIECGRDDSYAAMHQAALGGQSASLCGGDEGMHVLDVIRAAEKAAQDRIWIEL